MLAGTYADEAEVNQTIAVTSPAHAEAQRPGGVPSLELLRQLFPELEILAILGAGGMGAVFKARQPRLNRQVALKVMVGAPGHEADFALRFEREAQVLARLNHPHIVTLYDFGDLGPERTGADPLFYFLMEFVDGTDLGQLIKSRELMPAQALAIVPQICDALQYAHDQGITHRDIKPANILIDKRGVVKVADFGLAKVIGSAEDAMMTGLTQTGTAMGTPHYMAPEQWEHPEQVDHRADIYALGVVFYEMLTGERPAGVFEPPSRKSSPPVDRKLDSVVMRAMDKNPDRRYQQAGQIGDDVTRISGAHKRKPSPQTSPGLSRSPLKRLLALSALGLIGLGGWWAQQRAPVAEIPTAAFSPGQWINLDQQLLDQGNAKPTTEGWLLLAKQGPQGGRISLPKSTATNAGLRGRFQGSDFKDLNAPYLRLRASDKDESSSGIQLHLDVENQVPTIWIKQFSTLYPNGIDLLKRPLAAPLPPDREYTLELYIIGSQVIARCNQELFEVNLEKASAGFGQTALIEHLGPDRFRDLEFINLDGLGEAEALKKAGLTGTAPPAYPGRLLAAGTTANGKPHDMTKFAAFDDFVDVAGGWGRWVALRANGDTVSSDGKSDLTGIRSIVCSFNGEYGFLDTHGKLRLRSETRLTLPPALATAQVEDAALGSAHGLALLPDRTAVAFGSRYENTVDDPTEPKGYGTPRWPQPPEEALREVQAVAVASTHAATLRRDGTVTVWGWEGRVEWSAEPRLKRVRQLVSSEDSLWLLDEAGQVWIFALPRNPTPNQPIFSAGRLKLIASDATTVRERCWRQRDGTWRSDSQKADTSLQNLRLPEGVALSVNIGTYSGKPFASLLWIEPTK